LELLLIDEFEKLNIFLSLNQTNKPPTIKPIIAPLSIFPFAFDKDYFNLLTFLANFDGLSI